MDAGGGAGGCCGSTACARARGRGSVGADGGGATPVCDGTAGGPSRATKTEGWAAPGVGGDAGGTRGWGVGGICVAVTDHGGMAAERPCLQHVRRGGEIVRSPA